MGGTLSPNDWHDTVMLSLSMVAGMVSVELVSPLSSSTSLITLTPRA